MGKQWTAEEVLGTVRAFQPACVIIAAAELDVFTVLKDGPTGAADLAGRTGADVRGMTVLLDALAAMELLIKRDRRYEVPPTVADTLTESGSHCAPAMVRHLGNCLRRWAQLAKVVLTGRPADREPSVRGAEGDTESFIQAMNETSGPIADGLVESLGPLSFKHLLDVGGGSGTWTIAFLRLAPQADATIFDLPDVIPMAARRMEEAGLAGRVRLVGGDFEKDELPGGADMAWLSAIVHQNSRQENRALFAKVFSALADRGRILIRDVVMDETRTRPPMGALFAVNMLVGTPGGGTFTLNELRDDLQAAGFADVKLLRRGEAMDSVVGAIKPMGP